MHLIKENHCISWIFIYIPSKASCLHHWQAYISFLLLILSSRDTVFSFTPLWLLDLTLPYAEMWAAKSPVFLRIWKWPCKISLRYNVFYISAWNYVSWKEVGRAMRQTYMITSSSWTTIIHFRLLGPLERSKTTTIPHFYPVLGGLRKQNGAEHSPSTSFHLLLYFLTKQVKWPCSFFFLKKS